MDINGYTLINNVYANNNLGIKNEFEQSYIAIRQQENRFYSDSELQSLPFISESHSHFKEWAMRKKSAYKLFNYLAKKNKALKILEVGCGNGWLSNFLSQIENSYVIGLDINFSELQQAANFFKKNNLIFVYDNFSDQLLPKFKFDIIVFAASAQYFLCLQKIIKAALARLNSNGEIHILDTNFYGATEVVAAKKRTENYYAALGFPGFSQHYHHHSLNELNIFSVEKLYDPSSIKNIFARNKNPFSWFCVKGKAV